MLYAPIKRLRVADVLNDPTSLYGGTYLGNAEGRSGVSDHDDLHGNIYYYLFLLYPVQVGVPLPSSEVTLDHPKRWPPNFYQPIVGLVGGRCLSTQTPRTHIPRSTGIWLRPDMRKRQDSWSWIILNTSAPQTDIHPEFQSDILCFCVFSHFLGIKVF